MTVEYLKCGWSKLRYAEGSSVLVNQLLGLAGSLDLCHLLISVNVSTPAVANFKLLKCFKTLTCRVIMHNQFLEANLSQPQYITCKCKIYTRFQKFK